MYNVYIMRLCLIQLYTSHYLESAINCSAVHSPCSEWLLLLQWQQWHGSLFHVGEFPWLLQERSFVRGDDSAQCSATKSFQPHQPLHRTIKITNICRIVSELRVIQLRGGVKFKFKASVKTIIFALLHRTLLFKPSIDAVVWWASWLYSL